MRKITENEKEWLINELRKWFKNEDIKLKDDVGLRIIKEIDQSFKKGEEYAEKAKTVFDNSVRICGKCNTIMIEDCVS